jgi:hypothetical protein
MGERQLLSSTVKARRSGWRETGGRQGCLSMSSQFGIFEVVYEGGKAEGSQRRRPEIKDAASDMP